jgi:DNA-binding NtrC family response regulator
LPFPSECRSTCGASQQEAHPRGCGLATIEQWIEEQRTGLVRVAVTPGDCLDAVHAHLRRVARRAERRLDTVDTRFVDGCVRHLALRLGVWPLPLDVLEAARRLEDAADRRVLVVKGGVAEGGWDAACLGALRAERCLVIELVPRDTKALGDTLWIHGCQLEELRHWWNAAAQELEHAREPLSLARLHARWSDTGQARDETHLSTDARLLLTRLQQARTAWPVSALDALGSGSAVRELVDGGWIALSAGLAVLQRHALCQERVDPGQLADALVRTFPDDPWVGAKAAALWLQEGRHAHSCGLFRSLMHRGEIAPLRRDIWNVWLEAVRALDNRAKQACLAVACETSLAIDEYAVALTTAEQLWELEPENVRHATWLLGRAQLGAADAATARVTLMQAARLSKTAEQRMEATAFAAEASLLDGDRSGAHALAAEVLASDPPPTTRRQARNVLGKVLLAEGRWDEAEQHFAEDELESREWQMRTELAQARVNRGVTLISRGEARAAEPLLESVLQWALESGKVKAEMAARFNLGVVAHVSGDYARALDQYQRVFASSRQTGDRLAAHSVAPNLAELRAELGLLDEALQAIRFVRDSAQMRVTPARRARFAIVAGRIHLQRGDTTAAMREASEAAALLGSVTHGGVAGECYRLKTRIALHDGDVAQAAESLRRCESCSTSADDRAEVEILRARWLRASGQDAREVACTARSYALESGSDALVLESSTLLAQLCLACDDFAGARRHIDAAVATRERLLARFPPFARAGFHDRPECRAIEELLGALAQGRREEAPVPPSSTAPPAPTRTAFVGEHPCMLRLLSTTRRVAAVNSPVLIHGESGTGKELIARLLHEASPRRSGPFVVVNCGALVQNLLLSELFGHERGAFTGAASRRIGRFELADGGTLFLDEIGDISEETQVALLRVLQNHTFERVGGTRTIRSDVRVLCATHRDLEAMVAAGTFRQDLYYRLCGVVLEVPPLRDRGNDVLLLAKHILARIATEHGEPPQMLAPGACDALRSHPWRGNVRELENVMRAATVLCESSVIEERDVRQHIRTTPAQPCDAWGDASEPTSTPDDTTLVESIYRVIRDSKLPLPEFKRQIEEGCLALALADSEGQITRAASLLGMKRPRVSQLVKSYGLRNTEQED